MDVDFSPLINTAWKGIGIIILFVILITLIKIIKRH